MESKDLERIKEEVKSDVNNFEDVIYLLTLDNIIKLYEDARNVKKEYEFIKVLDNYLSYIKNNYSLKKIEYPLLVDVTVPNEYSKLEENENAFRKIFLTNFYENINYYSKFVDDNSSLYKLYLKFSEYDYDKDILEIEKIVKEIINDRNILVANAFISYREVNNDDNFFIVVIDNLIKKYFE